MSISVNYILEQERKKKLQQEQKDVPGVSAIAQGRAQQEQSKPTEQQLNETAQQPVAQSKSFDEEYPLVYNAYQKYAKPKNESVLPNPNAQPVQEDEEFPTVGQLEQPQANNPNKPESWSDEEYNAVKRLYSDEQIQSLYNTDPNEFLNGIISQVYKANTPQPSAPDEKQMKRQARYAAIGDALSLFSQAAGAAQGAHVRERKFEEGAMARLTDSQQKLYNNYLTRADQYSRGLVNAQMQDYLRGEQNWKETQKGVSQVLAQYRKEKIELAKQAQKDALDRDKLADTKKRTDAYVKNIDEMGKERKERLAIAKQNANTQAERTKAYIEKLNNPTTSGKKAEYQITIPAHPDDPYAENAELGTPVRTFEMTKAQQEKYTRDALADPGFKERHPEFFTINSSGVISHTVEDKREIAAAYVQEQYNNSFRVDAGGVDAGVYAGKLGSQVKPPTKDSFAQVASDKEFLKYVKQRNPDLHAAMKSGEIKRKDEQDYIIQIHKEWLENNKQDPVEQSMQKVQELDAEYDLDDEFAIVGTL